MRPAETASASASAARPRWSEVLRALREARGVTLAGWGARLGVSRTTVQRWERGERVPDPGAESAILVYCHQVDLFRAYDTGPLKGLGLTADVLRDLLAEARWGASARPAAPANRARTGNPATAAPPPSGPWPCAVNFPAQLTSFVGREQEIAAAARVQASTRLLTLTGAGGCGKTRLALELARELLWAYSHGIRVAELAVLADPALVPETVATALGVRPTGARPTTEEEVSEFLDGRHLLLVLDNCEHLVTACAHFAEALLRASPNAGGDRHQSRATRHRG